MQSQKYSTSRPKNFKGYENVFNGHNIKLVSKQNLDQYLDEISLKPKLFETT